jgi:hypothetical protein
MALAIASVLAACTTTEVTHVVKDNPPPSDQPSDDAGTSDDDGGPTTPDAGPPVKDAGPPDTNPPPNDYAKFHPSQPQLQTSGGRVLTNPKFQAITFPADPFRTQIETFVQKIGASGYWSATTKEYGISAGTALTPVHLTESPPTNIDDSDIKVWLRGKIDGKAPGFAPPDDNTLYAIYYPAGTTITLGGTTSCQYFGGYHEEVTLGSGQTVSYAVMPRCSDFGGLQGIDAVTFTSSHELFEAATDSMPETNPAYNHVDDEHFAWSYVFLPEGGDLCVQSQILGARPTDIGFMVQRTWSNAWAKTGHHPCVPGDGAPYFNSAPVLPDTLTFTTYQGQMQVTTKGVHIPVGQSKTIDVQLFSDAPVSSWQVTAIDWAGLQGGQGEELGFSFDKNTGTNGDVLHLTIQALQQSSDGFSAFLIQSKSGSDTNYWVGAVAN